MTGTILISVSNILILLSYMLNPSQIMYLLILCLVECNIINRTHHRYIRTTRYFIHCYLLELLTLFRSSHRRCSLRKVVLRYFAKFTRKYLCQSVFFNKVAGRPFLKEHLRWLLLIIHADEGKQLLYVFSLHVAYKTFLEFIKFYVIFYPI